jgi:exonuclease VII small subunit
MAGMAMKSIMEELKKDLEQVVRSMEAANTPLPQSKQSSRM